MGTKQIPTQRVNPRMPAAHSSLPALQGYPDGRGGMSLTLSFKLHVSQSL